MNRITDVFDSASDWARNTLQIVKGPIVDDLILNDGIKTIDKFQNICIYYYYYCIIVFNSLNSDLLVDDLKSILLLLMLLYSC